MRKGRDGEKNVKNGKKLKRMMFILATKVIASRLTERQPTGTLEAHANIEYL